MRIWFLKLLFWLQLQAGKLVDQIFELFNVFAGLKEVRADGQDIDLLTYFLDNKTVRTVFWAIVVIGVGVSTILTIVALTKSIFTKKKMAQIVGHYAVSIVSMVVTATCVLMFVFLANGILGSINGSFQKGDLTVSDQIISNCVEPPKLGADGKPVKDKDGIEDTGGWYLKKENGKPDRAYNIDDYKASDTKTEDGFFGTWKRLFGFEIEGDKEDGAISGENNEKGDRYESNSGMVNINKYNFVMGLFATITLLIVALTASMGLVSRLFDMVFLLLTSPLIMATIPLDEGAKFKLWRETVISKVMLAYGSVFAINIFIIMLPLINKISILGQEATSQIMRLLLIVCGGLTVSAGQLLFSRLIGTSAEESRQMTHGMRQLGAGIMATAGLAKGAGRMVFGTRNAMTGNRERGMSQMLFGTKGKGEDGARSAGLMGHIGKGGAGAGKVLFGASYRKPLDYVNGKASKVKNAVKGKFAKNYEKGGLLGGTKKHQMQKAYGGKENYKSIQGAFDKMHQQQDDIKSHKKIFM